MSRVYSTCILLANDSAMGLAWVPQTATFSPTGTATCSTTGADLQSHDGMAQRHHTLVIDERPTAAQGLFKIQLHAPGKQLAARGVLLALAVGITHVRTPALGTCARRYSEHHGQPPLVIVPAPGAVVQRKGPRARIGQSRGGPEPRRACCLQHACGIHTRLWVSSDNAVSVANDENARQDPTMVAEPHHSATLSDALSATAPIRMGITRKVRD